MLLRVLLLLGVLVGLAQAQNFQGPGEGNWNKVINLRSLGLPTGNDDTAAINNALTKAAALGAVVYAPAGTYKHADLVIIPSNTGLYGDGPVTNFQASFIWVNTGTTNPHEAIKLNGTNVFLRDIATTSTWPQNQTNSRQGNNEAQAVWVSGSTNYVVRNVNITAGAAGGIFQETSQQGEVTSNVINTTQADGIGIYSSSHDIVVTNNRVIGVLDVCYSIVDYNTDSPSINNIRYTGNNCINGTAAGFGFAGGNNVTVTGNVITNTANSCLMAQTDVVQGTFPPHDMTFSGNICNNTPNNNTSGYEAPAYVGNNTTPSGTAFPYNINFIGNTFTSVQLSCFEVGDGDGAHTRNISIIGNSCIGLGTAARDGVREQGVINLRVIGNTFKNLGEDGVIHVSNGASTPSSGGLIVTDNICDDIAQNFGYCVNFATATDMAYSSAAVRNNFLNVDGSTGVQGVVFINMAKGRVDGNWGDSVTTSTISGGISSNQP